jgi:hypothetical protein
MPHAMNHAQVPSHTTTLVTIQIQELDMKYETLANVLGFKIILTP